MGRPPPVMIARMTSMTSITSTMRTFENHLPRRVITGRGTSEGLLPICQAHGWRRVFLASDAGVEAAGLTGRVARPLEAAGLLADTFSAVPPEPPIAVVDELASRIVAAKADAVLALGGGSVMDVVRSARQARPGIPRHRQGGRPRPAHRAHSHHGGHGLGGDVRGDPD